VFLFRGLNQRQIAELLTVRRQVSTVAFAKGQEVARSAISWRADHDGRGSSEAATPRPGAARGRVEFRGRYAHTIERRGATGSRARYRTARAVVAVSVPITSPNASRQVADTPPRWPKWIEFEDQDREAALTFCEFRRCSAQSITSFGRGRVRVSDRAGACSSRRRSASTEPQQGRASGPQWRVSRAVGKEDVGRRSSQMVTTSERKVAASLAELG